MASRVVTHLSPSVRPARRGDRPLRENIEVIYDHVILVLKGVSLSGAARTIVALLGGQLVLEIYHPKAIST